MSRTNPFETPNKRNFPGDFKTPASVAPPRRPNFANQYGSGGGSDFGSRNLYPDLSGGQHQDDGLPQELFTPQRSQSYNPYGTATTPEAGMGGGVPARPSTNALVQQPSLGEVAQAQQMREAMDNTLGPVQLAARTIHNLLEQEMRYPALDDIVGREYMWVEDRGGSMMD